MKTFQFNPSDYNTDYQTIQNIYKSGKVLSFKNQVVIEYTFDWQIMELFMNIPNTMNHPPLPAPPENQRNKWDKPLALMSLPFLIWYLIWLFFL